MTPAPRLLRRPDLPDDLEEASQLAAPSFSIPRLPVGSTQAPEQPHPMLASPLSQPDIHRMGHEQELSRLEQSKPGVEGIRSPFLRTLARIGDVAGSIAVPGAMAAIPGTSLHHQELINRERGALGEEAKTAAQQAEGPLRQAQTEEAKARIPQIQAETEHSQAQAEALRHPAEKEFPLTNVPPGHSVIDRNGKVIFTAPEAPAKAKEPTNAFELFHQQNPNATAEDWLKIEVANKPEAANEYRDFKQGYMVKHPQAGLDEIARAFAETKKIQSPDAALAALDRETQHFGKTHQSAVDAANSQLEKIADARAMINGSAEAQAVGLPKVLTALVSGQGSGVRITQAELNMLGKARGIAGSVEGFINGLAGKGKLSSAQQQQLSQLLDDVRTRIQQKQAIANDALDKINSASSRKDIVAADKEARQKITALEQATGGSIGGSLPTVTTRQQFDALPSGATYIGKDGGTYRKP